MGTRALTDVTLLSQLVATQEAASAAELDLDAVVHEVVERALGLTRADAAVLERVDGDELVYRAVAGTAEGHVGLRVAAASSLSGLCGGTGEIAYSDDRSTLVAPVRHGGGVPYVLRVCSSRKAAFGEREEQVLRMLAASLAAAVARTELLSGLRRASKRLAGAGRLQDEFSALVQHELREPLTSMAGFVDALLRGAAGDLSEQQRQFLGMAARNGERLGGFVDDLLLAAELESGKIELELEDVELGELAELALRSAAPQAERAGVRVELEAAGEVHVPGDRVRLAQVLDKLIASALKLTAEGGHLRVEVAADAAEAVATVRASTATEDTLPGHGLGFSIAKALVDLHGGTLEPESAEGEGSTFRVRLPLAA
jgi:signal transduction histidine kinase